MKRWRMTKQLILLVTWMFLAISDSHGQIHPPPPTFEMKPTTYEWDNKTYYWEHRKNAFISFDQDAAVKFEINEAKIKSISESIILLNRNNQTSEAEALKKNVLSPALKKKEKYINTFFLKDSGAFKVHLDLKNYNEKDQNWLIHIFNPLALRKEECLINITPEEMRTLWQNQNKIIVWSLNSIFGTPSNIFHIGLKNNASFAGISVSLNVIESNDVVVDNVEVEASFPGGTSAWIEYLQEVLSGFNPAERGAKPGKYTVKVRFIVMKDGSISSVTALTNHGFGMEEAVIKMIEVGPKWNPAIQDGKLVKAYRIQPVTFLVEK